MSTQPMPTMLEPQDILDAYAQGLFPMAESADDPELFWVDPQERGIFPLDGLHISRRLARTLCQTQLRVRVDHDCAAVIDACAMAGPGREDTWINSDIRRLYLALFDQGHVHSVEVIDTMGALVGGLYGVSMGGAFFGESMFHRVTDASKIALLHLAARLRAGGYSLLDTQFVTPHLASLGAIGIPRQHYHQLLQAALAQAGRFMVWPADAIINGEQVLDILHPAPPAR